MADVIRVNDRQLWAAVETALDEAVEDVSQQAQDAIIQTGKEAARDVRSRAKAAFKGRGKYAAGWKVHNHKAGMHTTATVYNSTEPSLAHLLELGHEQIVMGHDTGRRYPGVPHLEAAFQDGQRRLEELMRRAPR